MTALPVSLVNLGDVVDALGKRVVRLVGDRSLPVSGLSQDSRRVLAGEIFAARTGKAQSGLKYLDAALARGAVALLVEAGNVTRELQIPVVEVDDIEGAIAAGAEAAFGFPSKKLQTIGITGTNGKTTSTWLVQQALVGAGKMCASLGTLGFNFQGVSEDTGLTTPEADAICRFEKEALTRGATHFAMEVSSHALVQQRVEGKHFSVAAFTNLTQDHLDFHGSMESYFLAKARLFTDFGVEVSVIHTEHEWGKRLARMATGRVLSIGDGAGANVKVRQFELGPRGLSATVSFPSGLVDLVAPLTGKHNLENCLTALSVVEALGLDVRAAATALQNMPQVPGRMERCDAPEDDIAVIVDYAHTPDALCRALSASRELTSGRLICVFGCGGDRDAAKRPLMGESVRALADFAFITNDNPRSESPQQIARAIEAAFAGDAARYSVVLDRSCAISDAILGAAPGDVVVIAGKGHESYQIIGSVRSDFDDRAEAKRALSTRRAARRQS
ncbi:MAG: UDP-N-acetylmuramoyl-L-alanyl-D-glutamate--2,6-diaminopimelate ligase [Polyangiaceae bacterium]|nr:UDP-N-acetylmuramoyl-L-alanyl-D-glutamate--2,6-diaminopimelate ligase [Polyangiaceae bacterium]